MNLFTCDQLTYQYPATRHPAIHDVTLTISQGEFVLLAGSSGSGKSTFLRALNGLVPRFYGGQIAGKVSFAGQAISHLTHREIVASIGFLQQDPERQLLLEQVERELAFGLENLGIPASEMHSRLAEVSHLFGLGELLAKSTSQLSGGEKQRVALASVIATYPQVLLLDEPTSQLDPIHAEEVLQAIRRLNEEWGMTIIMSEHRLDRCFHIADRLILFEQGEICFDGSPRSFVAKARDEESWQRFTPPISRHFIKELGCAEIPLTVKEARTMRSGSPNDKTVGKTFTKLHTGHSQTSLWKSLASVWAKKESAPSELPLLEIKKGFAGYGENPDVLRDLHFAILPGQRIALFGENGAGKSTLAKVLAGVVPLRKGELRWQGGVPARSLAQAQGRKVGYLSQNPNDYFLHDTVAEEIAAIKGKEGSELLELLGLSSYQDRHPHDLSGGEKQRLALAIVLAGKPQLLLLDEPTRGLDQREKEKLVDLLHALPVEATLLITHDIEFAALYANRISVLYRGQIVADGEPEQVFSQSFYYMPQVYKWKRDQARVR